MLLRLPVVLALDRRVFVADLFSDGVEDILRKGVSKTSRRIQNCCFLFSRRIRMSLPARSSPRPGTSRGETPR